MLPCNELKLTKGSSNYAEWEVCAHLLYVLCTRFCVGEWQRAGIQASGKVTLAANKQTAEVKVCDWQEAIHFTLIAI